VDICIEASIGSEVGGCLYGIALMAVGRKGFEIPSKWRDEVAVRMSLAR
jgi:hypothetical protein